VGEVAPDFELDGTDGPFKLSAHAGTNVVLLFYPADSSLVCTRQFCFYRDHATELDALGALTIGISPQDLDSHVRFREAHALSVPLLADVDGAVAAAYGVRSRGGWTRRATFIVDGAGIVRHRHENRLSVTFDSVADIRSALARLEHNH
jgi:peroxiredoxin Q/BCP